MSSRGIDSKIRRARESQDDAKLDFGVLVLAKRVAIDLPKLDTCNSVDIKIPALSRRPLSLEQC